MPIESLLLLIVVVEAVWIISSVFRGKEEEKKRPPGRPMPQRQGPVGNRGRTEPTTVDQFLNEVNRRRQETADREEYSMQPEPTRTERPTELRRRRSAPTDSAVVVLPVLPAKETRRIGPVSVTIPAVAVEVAPSSKLPEFKPSRVVTNLRERIGAEPSTSAPAPVSALHDEIVAHLRNRQSLQSAILLQEVLGPPLSMRSR